MGYYCSRCGKDVDKEPDYCDDPSPWTDCRDALPPEHQPVLVCWQGERRVNTATNNRWPWNGTRRRWLLDGHTHPPKVPPTHWMALPVAVGVEP